MSMQLEAGIEAEIDAQAKADGWLVRRLQWLYRRGAPDRFCARATAPCPSCGRAGDIVLLEIKRPGGRMNGRQPREIKSLQDAGVRVAVVDSVDSAMEVLS